MTRKDLELMQKWKKTWEETYNGPYDREKWKKLEDQMQEELEQVVLTDEDKKTLFKDYGCRNGWHWNGTSQIYAVVNALHEIDKKRNPGDHHERESTPYTCYHQTTCKCGLASAYDSGG